MDQYRIWRLGGGRDTASRFLYVHMCELFSFIRQLFTTFQIIDADDNIYRFHQFIYNFRALFSVRPNINTSNTRISFIKHHTKNGDDNIVAVFRQNEH